MTTPAGPITLLDTSVLIPTIRMGELGRYLEATYSLSTVQPPPLISVVTEGETRAFMLKHGLALSKNDLWIAASAHVTGATLLTSDADFDPLDSVFLRRIWVDPSSRLWLQQLAQRLPTLRRGRFCRARGRLD